MDGLPGMRRAVETAKRENVKPMKKMVGPLAPSPIYTRSRTAWQVPTVYLIVVMFLSFGMGIMATVLSGIQLGYLRG
jgi:hypothetical protein